MTVRSSRKIYDFSLSRTYYSFLDFSLCRRVAYFETETFLVSFCPLRVAPFREPKASATRGYAWRWRNVTPQWNSRGYELCRGDLSIGFARPFGNSEVCHGIFSPIELWKSAARNLKIRGTANPLNQVSSEY